MTDHQTRYRCIVCGVTTTKASKPHMDRASSCCGDGQHRWLKLAPLDSTVSVLNQKVA